MGYRYGIPAARSHGNRPGAQGNDRTWWSTTARQVIANRPDSSASLSTWNANPRIQLRNEFRSIPATHLVNRLWCPIPQDQAPRPDERRRSRAVDAAALRVSTWPLVIDESSSLTADQLCARARISKRKQKTAIVCVDYLQKMRFNGNQSQRYLDVTSACVAMAGLAKDEDLALLLISSVSERSGKNRNDAPTLQDFRQSGDIAYEASTALLIHREIDEETERPMQDGMIIIAKARSDEGGAVRVWFNTNTLTFEASRTGTSRQAVAS